MTCDDDDRLIKWFDANSIVSIGRQRLSDGKLRVRYFRADGSEVFIGRGNSYPYDAITPYSRVAGKA
jgi:hypothetical protein